MEFKKILSILLGIMIFIPSITAFAEPENLLLECSLQKIASDENNRTVYFYVDTDYEGEYLTLVSVDDGTEYKMVDDGKYSQSGDDLPLDGIYTAKFDIKNINVPYGQTKTLSFYAVTPYGEKSNTVKIKVYNKLTDINIEEMAAVDNEITKLQESETFKKADYNEKESLAKKLLEELATR